MRRALSVVTVWALAGVLSPLVAFASFQTAFSSPTPSEFRAQVFSRAFGERALQSDDSETTSGDALGGSFFGTFALRVTTEASGSGIALISIPAVSLPLLSSRLFAPSSLGALPATISVRDDDYRAPVIASPGSVASASPAIPLIGMYQGSMSVPSAPPSTFHFDLTSSTALSSRLVTFSPIMDPQAAFTAGSVDAGATLPQTQAGVAVPVRVGHVHLQTHVDGAQAIQPNAALRDAAINAGATFNTRLGSHKLDVDLSSGFEHMTVNDPATSSSSFDGTSNYQLSNVNLPVLIPAYADVSKRTLSAGFGVPVARNVSLQVQYDAQHLQGGYGSPGLANLDARNNIYGGKVTLQIPHTSGAISLSAKQYRYQDNLVPANAFTQTSADINFTVKF